MPELLIIAKDTDGAGDLGFDGREAGDSAMSSRDTKIGIRLLAATLAATFLAAVGCSRQANEAWDQASQFIEGKDYETACACLDKVILLNPKRAGAYFERGKIHLLRKRFEKAIDDFDKAVSLGPENGECYYQLGVAYAGLHDYQPAIDSFSHAIVLEQNHAKVYCDRGKAFLGRHELAPAIGDFTKAIELDKDDFEAYHERGIALLEAAQRQPELGDVSSAIRSFEAALEGAASPKLHYDLGLAYERSGRSEKAVESFQNAYNTLKVGRESAQLYYDLGLAFERLRRSATPSRVSKTPRDRTRNLPRRAVIWVWTIRSKAKSPRLPKALTKQPKSRRNAAVKRSKSTGSKSRTIGTRLSFHLLTPPNAGPRWTNLRRNKRKGIIKPAIRP